MSDINRLTAKRQTDTRTSKFSLRHPEEPDSASECSHRQNLKLSKLRKYIKMPEEADDDPNEIFKNTVTAAVNPQDPKNDIITMNTNNEVQSALIEMNRRKQDLIRAKSKEHGI